MTLISAPSAALLADQMARLTQPQTWAKMQGRALILSSDDAVSIPAPEIAMRPTQAWSISNMRLVMAAWFSMNPYTHTGLMIALALLFGGTTVLCVRQGRKDGADGIQPQDGAR